MNANSLSLTHSLLVGLALSLLGVAAIALRYPGAGSSRVHHIESVSVAAFLILAVIAFVAWRMKVNTTEETADIKSGTILGLLCGAAWILEISFNNFVDPACQPPTRDSSWTTLFGPLSTWLLCSLHSFALFASEQLLPPCA
jgi:hypothetical protein